MATWGRAATGGLTYTSLLTCTSLVACVSVPPVVPGDVDAASKTVQAFGELDAVHLEGLIELHWTDDEGSHLEQGDLEVWIKGRTHASARVTKFSEIYLWTGSTPEGDFTFDLTGEPTTLTTTPPDQRMASILPAGALRRLLGIAGVPGDAVTTSMDDAVVITFDRPDGSRETLDLNAAGDRLTLVTIVTAKGCTVTAEHRNHDEGPRVVGRAFARYVDVRSDGDLARLFLKRVDTPSELPSGVFDVERLKVALRPDLVQTQTRP